MKLVAPLYYHSMLGNQGERPLLHMKLGALFYPDVRLFRCSSESREHRNIGIEPKPVIAPMASRHHPPIKVEDALQLGAIESGNSSPIPRMRKRRDDAQALLTFGSG